MMRLLHGLVCLLFLVPATHGRFMVHDNLEQISDQRLTRDRRQAEREAAACGQLGISTAAGSIVMDTEEINGTEFYGRNQNCTWSILAEEGHHVVLTSKYFDLEISEGCAWDYVEISEVGDSPVSERFCGYDPVTYISRGNEVHIHFRSDESFEDLGFHFDFISVEDGPTSSFCNHSIIGGEEGELSSPGYPGPSPDGDQLCFYSIQAPPGKVVQFSLEEVDFADRPCELEGLEIYDGISTQGEPKETICSDTDRGSLPFRAERAFLRYHATRTEAGDKGFLLGFQFVDDDRTTPAPPYTAKTYFGGTYDCSEEIELDGPSKVITSPAFERNKDCVTVVRNTRLAKHVVQVTFTTFDMEESPNCSFDYLKIISGARKDSPSLGTFCGSALQGRTFLTTGNTLRLEYWTDESFTLDGYVAEVSYQPVGACVCDGQDAVCMIKGNEKLCIRGQECSGSRCDNGGTCVRYRGAAQCYCPHGFQGDRCQEEVPGMVRPVQFKFHPETKSLARGAGYSTQCVLDGVSEAEVEYSWLFNNDRIGPFDERSGFGYHDGGLFQIRRFTEDMEGIYVCIAFTGDSMAEYNFKLTLQENCGARITTPPGDMYRDDGGVVIIPCATVNAEEVTWRKDGRSVDVMSPGSRFRKMHNNYLRIEGAVVGDSGRYQCEARGRGGCHITRAGTLTIRHVQRTSDLCGRSIVEEAMKARVTRGERVEPGESPWHVMLVFNTRTRETFCGGTLVSTSWIITAAHCVDYVTEDKQLEFNSQDVVLILGSTQCGETWESSAIERYPKSFQKHPAYNVAVLYDYDIALVELDSPVEYNDYVRPLCMGHPDLVLGAILVQNTLIPKSGKVAGCGARRLQGEGSEHLMKVLVPYVDWDLCKQVMYDPTDRIDRVTRSMICYGYSLENKGDACSGDSGGAIVMEFEGRWYQTGIVSWGDSCDKRDSYGVYTNVSTVYHWILDTTGLYLE